MSSSEVGQALSAPPQERGSLLLALEEDQWFDRKSARVKPQDLARPLVSLANAEGGVVVVGLSGGTVEGVRGNQERLNAQKQAWLDYCKPPVRADVEELDCETPHGPDALLVFSLEPSDMVHATYRDEVYLRVGDESRKLSYAQRRELELDKGQSHYEVELLGEMTTDDLNWELVEDYASSLRSSDPLRTLAARGLLVRNDLTVAGCLLFAEDPQSRLPEAYVRVLRYRGVERGAGARQQLIEDRRFGGPLPSQIFQAREAIGELQPRRRALSPDGMFEDMPLVPEDAWLEGLVNAVVHRSYSSAGDHIRFEIFDDRIEVHSPGRFPGLVDLSNPLEAPRFARNPRIARVCADLNFGQELGEGIPRMFEEMRDAGLTDPLYRQSSGSVTLTLSTEPVDRELDATLPAHAREITSALRDAGRLGTGEIAEAVGMSRPTARRVLDALDEAGIIEWVGKSPRDPRAYWRLKRST